jgi:AraC-like DNA-binding protein
MALPWDKLTVTIRNAGRVRCEPGWRLERPWSQQLEDMDLWYVWAGRGTMRLRDRQIDLHPGLCLWARPGRLYLADQDPTNRLGVNYCHFDLLRRNRLYRPTIEQMPEAFSISDPAYFEQVGQRLARLLDATDDDQHRRHAAADLLRAVLIDIDIGRLVRSQAGDDPTRAHHHQVVTELARRIDEQPGQSLSLPALARRAGYSQDHLCRIFKQLTGETPQQRMIRRRIQRAATLLSESSLTISQIADAMGYRDVYFFSRQFKQKMGQSPRTYRSGPTLAESHESQPRR